MRDHRQFLASEYWFVTDRCVDERFFLRAGKEVHEVMRILYVLMNPVRAGIAATVQEYPGLSSLEANTGMRGACGAIELPIALVPEWCFPKGI